MLGLSDKYKGFIFDMDGTIYLEDKMIEGAFETLNYLIENKKHILFVTNKTTQTKTITKQNKHFFLTLKMSLL